MQKDLDREAVTHWLTRYVSGLHDMRADRIAEMFALDARLELSHFRPPVVGRDGIARLWTDQFEFSEDIDIEFELWALRANLAFVHFSGHHYWTPTNDVYRVTSAARLEFVKTDEGLLCRSLEAWTERKAV
jgi:hypothetical protein